ncbi:MAG: hypothetical protein U5N86_10405 [Planctomycetota bacterium]|nr:hypothetical protein [Planctomycetota bacterium]
MSRTAFCLIVALSLLFASISFGYGDSDRGFAVIELYTSEG